MYVGSAEAEDWSRCRLERYTYLSGAFNLVCNERHFLRPIGWSGRINVTQAT